MINNNKILTVSYGTFSCTLEGFEDSFGTMKAIAEYFRDLAADDRYFGSEPAQPDAEMLARIAEREISRRVEAREDQGRIVLSAANAIADVAPDVDPVPEAATEVAPDESLAPATVEEHPVITPIAIGEDISEPDEAADLDDDADAVAGIPEYVNDDESIVVQDLLGDEGSDVDKDTIPEAQEDDEEAFLPEDDMTAELEAPTETETVVETEEEAVSELVAETEAEEETVSEAVVEAEGKAVSETVAETEAEEEVEEDSFFEATAETELEPEADTGTSAEAEAEAEAEAFFADIEVTASDEFEEIEEDSETTSDANNATLTESIAAKLKRIRAVVSQSRDDEDEDEDDMFEDEHATDTDDSPDLSQFVDLSEHAEDTYAEDDDAEPLNEVAAVSKNNDGDVARTEDNVDLWDQDAQNAQDKGQDLAAAPDYLSDAEDIHAEEVIEAAAQDIEAAMEVDDAMTGVKDTDEAEDEEDDVAAMLARFENDLSEVENADAPQDEAADEPDAASDSDDIGLDSLTALFDTDENETEEDTQNFFDVDAEVETSQNNQDEKIAPMVLSDEDLVKPGDDQFNSTDAVRARALRVKSADIDAAIASGQLEAVDNHVEDHSAKSSLSDEQEAELMAELSALEVSAAEPEDIATAGSQEYEMAGDDVDEDIVVDNMADAYTEEPEMSEAASSTSVDDDDVSRLMAEAENQMDEPEGSRRRNAFAHLKAAVIAKKADSDIGKADPETEGAFRSDLESVVVPRRPKSRGEGSARPDVKRPAPLKLVAEQRVDIDNAPKGPVRPRRVAASIEDALSNETDTNFAEYAEEMGANTLSDLLEAAASYLSFVEEREQFTRPQLMTKVRQVEGSEFSREDGLRSFGQLLRAGKIKKIKGGRFAATADIGYRPDHRAAG